MTDDRPALPPGQTVRDGLAVKHYGRVPRGRDPWRLSFGGDASSVVLAVDDLRAMPQVEVVADHHCAAGWSALGLRWSGVPAAEVLRLAPPPEGTTGALAVAEYGYSANLRLEDLRRPTTLLALGLDGAPLPPEHGAPVRLVVPHLFGYKSVKWLRGWEYLREERRGFWEERGYHVVGDPWSGRRWSYEE